MSLINDALKRAKHAQQKQVPPRPSPDPALRPAVPARQKPPNVVMLLPLALVVLLGGSGLIIWFASSAGGARPSSVTVVQARSISTPAPTAAATRPTLPATSELPPQAPNLPATQIPTTKLQIAQPLGPPTGGAPPVSVPLAIRGQNEHDVQPGLPVVPATLPPVSASDLSAASVQSESELAGPIIDPAPLEATATVTQSAVVVSGPPLPPPLPRLQGIVYRPERPAALLDGRTVLVGRTSGEYRVVAISQQRVTVVRAGQTNVLEMPD